MHLQAHNPDDNSKMSCGFFTVPTVLSLTSTLTIKISEVSVQWAKICQIIVLLLTCWYINYLCTTSNKVLPRRSPKQVKGHADVKQQTSLDQCSLCVRPVALKALKGMLHVCTDELEAIFITKGQSTGHYPQSILGKEGYHSMPCI